jgi:hypothetical protein
MCVDARRHRPRHGVGALAHHLIIIHRDPGAGFGAYRVIPLDGRPHIGTSLALWNGDARGRWDGNTLVIETTNQNARNFLDQRGRFYTEEARVTERFTRIDVDTIMYEATIDDPDVYTRPFTIAFPFRRNALKVAEVWEEACYESNEEQMILFRNNGFHVYPGITAKEAKELKAAWEAQGSRR